VNADRENKRRLAILSALKSRTTPLSSVRLAEALSSAGHDISERTVRLYLSAMAREGLSVPHGRRGSLITPKGLARLQSSPPLARIGIVSARIDRLTCAMDFDLGARSGTVVVNTTFVDRAHLLRCLDEICRVFRDGYAMGRLAALLGPGEVIGDDAVPAGMIGFCTVCSVTVNGVLLKHAIPMRPRFSGLLEIRHRLPSRLLEMIAYDGTSIDPLSLFVRGGMTDYLGAIRSGNGRVGVSFCEIPAETRETVLSLASKMAAIGLGGVLRVGMPAQQLLDIPVGEGRCGVICMGGLNPAAVFEERGHRVSSRALAGLIDFSRLFPADELRRRLGSM
jgi:HTH-type transcriptional regulator, global nitrogen regulator NrpRI